MKPRSIVFGMITAFVVLILFNNKEEASFWLFGEIRTSKLLILGVFFLLGVITGGLLFRRRRKQPQAFPGNNDDNVDTDEGQPSPYGHLSQEDRRFLGKDD